MSPLAKGVTAARHRRGRKPRERGRAGLGRGPAGTGAPGCAGAAGHRTSRTSGAAAGRAGGARPRAGGATTAALFGTRNSSGDSSGPAIGDGNAAAGNCSLCGGTGRRDTQRRCPANALPAGGDAFRFNRFRCRAGKPERPSPGRARPGPARIRRAVRAPPPGEPLRGAARENRSFAQVASPSVSVGVRGADKSRAGPARTAMWVVHAVLPWQTEWPCRTSGPAVRSDPVSEVKEDPMAIDALRQIAATSSSRCRNHFAPMWHDTRSSSRVHANSLTVKLELAMH